MFMLDEMFMPYMESKACLRTELFWQIFRHTRLPYWGKYEHSLLKGFSSGCMTSGNVPIY